MIVLSYFPSVERKISWLRGGAVDYVVKPFEMDDLAARIDAQMRQHRRRKELFSANAELSCEVGKLERLAIVDGLTQLYNHRYFQERLGAEFRRARRYGPSLSLILIDIDHFKNVNDTHGHQVGDAVLARFSEALMSDMRPSDLPARYGGEELVVILPETSRENARALAERIRERLLRLSFTGAGKQPFSVTASFGVASLEGSMAGPAELIEAADSCLYVAKLSGRNRTVVQEQQVTPKIAEG